LDGFSQFSGLANSKDSMETLLIVGFDVWIAVFAIVPCFHIYSASRCSEANLLLVHGSLVDWLGPSICTGSSSDRILPVIFSVKSFKCYASWRALRKKYGRESYIFGWMMILSTGLLAGSILPLLRADRFIGIAVSSFLHESFGS